MWPTRPLLTLGYHSLSSDQEAILDDLRSDIPLNFHFMFSETQAEVIPGKQEGVYAWVATNYALGKFDHSLRGGPSLIAIILSYF